jgi:glycolate oxidase FAD binding subunit
MQLDQASQACLPLPQLRALVGEHHVRPAAENESIRGIFAACTIEPGSEAEVAAVLQFANDSGLAVIPRGGATKLGWGNPPRRADIVLSLARLNQVLEHAWADLTVVAEAGCTISALQQKLGEHGQRLAIDPLWPKKATIGGVLAANDTGALRLGYGGLRDLVIGVHLALPDGTLARSGGKVVKNVAGYDLCKLSTGALGTLGIVTQVTLRVHPCAAGAATLTLPMDGNDSMQHLVSDLLNSNLSPACMQVRASSRHPAEIDIGLEGSQAGLAAQEAKVSQIAGKRSGSNANSLRSASGLSGVWSAREGLFLNSATATIAKMSGVPTSIADSLTDIAHCAEALHVAWQAVVQATGLGWLRIDPEPEDVDKVPKLVQQLRAAAEARGGSLVVLQAPPLSGTVDAWGNPGDSLSLMRAVKQQFDPRSTLNPGRFVGGI